MTTLRDQSSVFNEMMFAAAKADASTFSSSTGFRHCLVQPKRQSGHDTKRVHREVTIVKEMKTRSKFDRSLEVLQMTGKCYCTPSLYAYNGDSLTLLMEDLGNTLQENKMLLTTKEKNDLLEHFRREHQVVFAPCQVSPQNVCRRRNGFLCLVGVAKWRHVNTQAATAETQGSAQGSMDCADYLGDTVRLVSGALEGETTLTECNSKGVETLECLIAVEVRAAHLRAGLVRAAAEVELLREIHDKSKKRLARDLAS